MNRPPDSLRRILTALLAVTPLLASADLCMVGALTGRADLMCGMERTASACHAVAAPPARAHCASTRPAPEPGSAPSHGPTCCDLRPQAAGTGEAHALRVPPAASHPAAVAVSVSDLAPASPAVPVAADAGHAPPGDPPPPLSPRAPPLG